MSTYRLVYFDGKGAAEVSRILLNLANVPFIDDRFKERSELNERKATGEFTANLDRVPILVYDGTSIGQSRTIERFVAKKYGYFGSNEMEEVLIDMISEHCRDIKQKYYDARQGKTGDELEAAKKAYVADELPVWLAKLEKLVQPGGNAVGSKLSYADVCLFNLVYDYFDHKEMVEKTIESLPNIKACADNVKKTLKDYLASRPVTPW